MTSRNSTSTIDSSKAAMQIGNTLRDKITNYDAWHDLDQLLSRTEFDDVDIDPETLVIKGTHFSGPVNVYVILNYGEGKSDNEVMSESFLGVVKGYFDKKSQ